MSNPQTPPADVSHLLKPRYKVIADYPNSGDKVGSIYNLDNERQKGYYDKYPHLFKPLAWYEERKIDEMPKYVKTRHGVYEVSKWEWDDPKDENKEWVAFFGEEVEEYKDWIMRDLKATAATQSEYETYIKRNNEKTNTPG